MQALPDAAMTEPDQVEVDTLESAVAGAESDPIAESGDIVADDDSSSPALDPRVLDLADGMDGFHGLINSDNPAETIEFTAAGDGVVDVVLTSALDGGDAVMSITNSQGDLIQPQSAGVAGFGLSSFEVQEGETYQLAVESSGAKCEGHFQLTVAWQAHQDQHADELGADSTELDLSDNSAELSGRLESAGDVDTFRFTAPASGETMLELQETVDKSRIGLEVSVQDANGNQLATGATNESLQITFDAESGQEYFISIAAGEGQKGTYQIGMKLDAVDQQPTETVSVDVADEPLDTTIAETDEVAETDVVAEVESEPVDIVDELDPVDIGDESEPVDVASDPVITTDADELANCDVEDEGTEVIAPEIPAAPIVEQPTGEIADGPIADGSADDIVTVVDDQQSTDQQPDDEPVVVTTAEPVAELTDIVADCDGTEPANPGDASDSDVVSEADIEAEPIAGDLIVADSDDAVADIESDRSILGFENLDSIDNFFANYGNELELNFNFFFGLDGIDQIPSRG